MELDGHTEEHQVLERHIHVATHVRCEGLPIPLQQGDNDAGSLLQALVVYLKLSWRLAWF
jgi:hypothetical protein